MLSIRAVACGPYKSARDRVTDEGNNREARVLDQDDVQEIHQANIGLSLVMKVMKEKKGVRKTDYRGIYSLGICLMALGICLMPAVGPAFISFLACGVAFMAIGLSNRDKWAKVQKEA